MWTVALMAGLVVAAVFIQPLAVGLTPPAQTTLWVAAYSGVAAGLAVSAAFNQSRMLLALLGMGLLLGWLHGYPRGWIGWFPLPDPGTYPWVAFLIPLNVLLVQPLKERGVLTLNGLSRIAFVMIQPFALTMAGHSLDGLAEATVGREFLPFDTESLTPIPQPALAVYLVVGLLILIRWARFRAPLDTGFLGTLVTSGLGLHHWPSASAAGVFLVATAVAAVVALVQQSHRLAYRDELTGLPARRALRDQMLKLGGRFSIAMLDVDHFKRFNDRYGHDAGDQVLKMVASRMARAAGGGKPFRYGGEEFTLVFPGRETEEVLPHLDALRGVIERDRFVLRGKDRPRSQPKRGERRRAGAKPKGIAVTISIGVADNRRREDTPETVLKAADQALYRAKRKGRNRISR